MIFQIKTGYGYQLRLNKKALKIIDLLQRNLFFIFEKMSLREFGKTGVKIPAIGLGCMVCPILILHSS
jgi:hypothetical protein